MGAPLWKTETLKESFAATAPFGAENDYFCRTRGNCTVTWMRS